MQCAELEERIGQLLDEGRLPDNDPLVVGHVGGCSKCETLVQAYRDMLAGADALPIPELSQTFATRTVERAFSADRQFDDAVDDRLHTGRLHTGRLHTGQLGFGTWPWLAKAGALAVAASLFVAATIWWRSAAPSGPGAGDLATTMDGGSPISVGRQNLPPEQIHAVCLSTGQSLVMLPAVIRRVDTTRLTGHMRPVVRPMGAAWEALKRTLPSGEPAVPDAGGDTGWILGAEQSLVS